MLHLDCLLSTSEKEHNNQGLFVDFSSESGESRLWGYTLTSSQSSRVGSFPRHELLCMQLLLIFKNQVTEKGGRKNVSNTLKKAGHLIFDVTLRAYGTAQDHFLSLLPIFVNFQVYPSFAGISLESKV